MHCRRQDGGFGEYDVGKNLLVPFHWQRQLAAQSGHGATCTILRDGEMLQINILWQPYTVAHPLQRGGALWGIGLVTSATILVLIAAQRRDPGARIASLALAMIALNQVNNIVRTTEK